MVLTPFYQKHRLRPISQCSVHLPGPGSVFSEPHSRAYFWTIYVTNHVRLTGMQQLNLRCLEMLQPALLLGMLSYQERMSPVSGDAIKRLSGVAPFAHYCCACFLAWWTQKLSGRVCGTVSSAFFPFLSTKTIATFSKPLGPCLTRGIEC